MDNIYLISYSLQHNTQNIFIFPIYDLTAMTSRMDMSSGSRERINVSRDGRGEALLQHSETHHHSGRRASSKESRTSLAEDIHSIRIALNGASATAKERTLKTLERLTARLALAESERDVALGMCLLKCLWNPHRPPIK